MDEFLEDYGVPELEPVAGFSGGRAAPITDLDTVRDKLMSHTSYYVDEDSSTIPDDTDTIANISNNDELPVAPVPEEIKVLLMEAAMDPKSSLFWYIRAGLLQYAFDNKKCERGSKEAEELERTLSELDDRSFSLAARQSIILSSQSQTLAGPCESCYLPHSPSALKCFFDYMIKETNQIDQRSLSDANNQPRSNCVPSGVHEAMEWMVNDPHTKNYIMNQLRQNIRQAEYSRNTFKPNTAEVDVFVADLNTTNTHDLASVYGQYLISSHPSNKADKIVQNLTETAQPSANNLNRGVDMTNSLDKQGPSPGPTPAKQFKSEKQVERRIYKLRSAPDIFVSPDTWDRAYGLLTKNKLELICKLFFEKVFSPDEIGRQTFSGKFGTEKFDPDKIAWIRAACAFIWGRPQTNELTAENFQQQWETGLLDIEEDKWKLVEKRIFTEHAFQLRSKQARGAGSSR